MFPSFYFYRTTKNKVFYHERLTSLITSTHSPELIISNNELVSRGVCETTFSNCLCDQTSFSNGAIFKSPTKILLFFYLLKKFISFHLKKKFYVQIFDLRNIRFITTCWHIKIMNFNIIFKFNRKMSSITFLHQSI